MLKFIAGLARKCEPQPLGGGMATGKKLGLAAKRGMDVLGATAGLALLSPILLVVSMAVAIAQGRPILFRQTRPGRGGKPFNIYKFRTMRPPRPGEIAHRTDPQRVTRLGRFLRETSLDELPELWNVLRGDMSLVGPRPLLMDYLDKYTRDEARRHDMLPGITGWAAVNGRHKIRFRDRLALDTWYVDHWSLWLDLKIMAMTVHQVIRRKDVSTTESIELGFPLSRGPSAVASETAAPPCAGGGGDPAARGDH
jgi:sugar transferase EpsL